jgi:thioredoxin reductase (NADPH)
MNTSLKKFLLASITTLSVFALYAPINKKDIKTLLKDKKNLIHTAIIGAGPAGLSSAIPPKRAGYHVVVFTGPKPGGELREASMVENWPGLEKKSGAECMKMLDDQVDSFGIPRIPLSVTEVDFSSWPYRLKLSDETSVYALTVNCATGASQGKLGIEGEDLYYGKGLYSCGLCDAGFTRNKDTVVIGGGDIAIQRALQLIPEARKISLIIPGSRMTAHASMQKKIDGIEKIEKIFNKEIKKIVGDGSQIQYIELYDPLTKKTSKHMTDSVFLSTGLTPNTDLFKQHLELDQTGCIKLLGKTTQETSIEGVMASGNNADNIYRQVGVIIGDGTKAGLDAVKLLSNWGFDGKITIPDEQLYKPAQIPHPAIKHIKKLSELQRALRASRQVMVEIYSPTCSTCKKMEGPLSAVTEQFKNVMKVLQIDKNNLLNFIKKQNITLIPAFILYKNGKEIDRMEGETTFANLRTFIEKGFKLSNQAISSKEISNIG